MNLDKTIKLIIVFLLGFLSANIIGLYYVYGYEIPFSFNLSGNLETPSNFIDEKQIEIYDDRIILNIKGASLARYAPTGSMEPILDENSNGIRIVPISEEEINVGDIISFKKDGYLVVHRVIYKGTDNEGVYFITKGDNSSIADGKVRFDEIEYITIGVIW